MSAEREVPVLAVVVASHGGAVLARCLASVTWAAERVVLDPADRLGSEELPAGVRRATTGIELDALGTAPWVLLLGEEEVVPAALVAAIAASTAGAGVPRRLRREMTVLGSVLRMPGALVRLAPRVGTRLRLRGDLELELTSSGAAAERLGDALQVERAASVSDAVAALDADSTVLAALLEASGVRPRRVRAIGAGCRAAGAVLFAGMQPGGLQLRWTGAVLAGYRAIVAYAKLWERRRSRAIVLAVRAEDA